MTEPVVPWSRRIVDRALWTVIDQALLALANFGGNLILARWLTPVQYGAYMLASALFWMIMAAYNGSLTDPMMVFGSGRFRDQLSRYFAVLALFYWCISAMVSIGLAGIGLAMILWGSRAPGLSLVGYALAAPAVLLLSLLRRTVYLWSHPRFAASAGGAYILGMLAIMAILYRTAALSSFTAPLAAAGASALAIVMIFATRRCRLWSSWRGDFTRQVAVAHWRYGRWAIVTNIVSWAPAGLYYVFIVPVFAGLAANAALNALWNLVMPAIHLHTAFALLLVPAFSRARQNGRAGSLVWIVTAVLVAEASFYALAVSLVGGPLIDLFYRGRYTEYAHFSWLVGLAAFPTAAIAVFESFLRAHERPDRIFAAYMVSTAVACGFGIAAVATWGVLGAILGLLARDVTTMLVELWWVLRIGNRREPQTAAHLSIENFDGF